MHELALEPLDNDPWRVRAAAPISQRVMGHASIGYVIAWAVLFGLLMFGATGLEVFGRPPSFVAAASLAVAGASSIAAGLWLVWRTGLVLVLICRRIGRRTDPRPGDLWFLIGAAGLPVTIHNALDPAAPGLSIPWLVGLASCLAAVGLNLIEEHLSLDAHRCRPVDVRRLGATDAVRSPRSATSSAPVAPRLDPTAAARARAREARFRERDARLDAAWQRSRRDSDNLRAWAKDGRWVYVMQSGDRPVYKIGKSVNPVRRLAQLDRETLGPDPIRLVHAVEVHDMGYTERCLHRVLRRRETHRRGEWFDLSARTVERLRDAAPSMLRDVEAIERALYSASASTGPQTGLATRSRSPVNA